MRYLPIAICLVMDWSPHIIFSSLAQLLIYCGGTQTGSWVNQWISWVLGKDNPFPLGDVEKRKMEIFMAIACEQLWLVRNKIQLGGVAPDWRKLIRFLNRLSSPYWRIAKLKSPIGYLRKHRPQISKW